MITPRRGATRTSETGSEWRATIVTRETACLSLEHRTTLDRELAGTPEQVARLVSWSDRRTEGFLRARAAVLDAEAVTERRRRAEADRRVTARPAPDGMMHLHALLSVKAGVAVIAALRAAADTARAAGDPRSRHQLMADILRDQLTGQTCHTCDPADGEPGRAPAKVTINLVVPDSVLFGTAFTRFTRPSETSPSARDDAAGGAWVDGYGPIPADLAREWATETGTHLRRLYADPSGRLVAMDSHRRLFPEALKDLIRFRDHGICRISWCDAPLRHADHVVPVAEGGPTTYRNGQGLCETHNYTKSSPGWRQAVDPVTGEITTTTPTGHTYSSPEPTIREPDGHDDHDEHDPPDDHR